MPVFLQRLGILGTPPPPPGLSIPFANVVLLIQDGHPGFPNDDVFVDLSTGYGTHTMSQLNPVLHDDVSVPPLTDAFSSIEFPGSGWFEADDHNDFDLPGDYGIDMWVRCPVGGGGFLVTKYNFNSQRAFIMQIATATGFLHMTQYGQASSSSAFVNAANGTTDLRDGLWHHLCITHEAPSNQTMYIFVDGVLEGQNSNSWGGSWPIDATTSPVRFGSTDNDVNWFTGQIAWPRIWRDHTGPVATFTPPTAPPGTSIGPPDPVARVREQSIYTITGGGGGAPVVSARLKEVYTIIGPPQGAVSARLNEVYTITGAASTAVSLQSLEVFAIVGAPNQSVSLQSLEVYAIVEV